MKAPVAGSVSAVRAGDVVITLVLLVVFVAAYAAAQSWPFESRLFPQILSAAGIVFAVLQLVQLTGRVRRHQAPMRRAGPGAREVAGSEAEPEQQAGAQEHAPEYVFGTAGARAWSAAVGWVAVFFVSLYVFGVFVTVPLFAVVYLLVCGRHGLLGSTVYAGVAGGVVWLVFSRLLEVPMPAGIF